MKTQTIKADQFAWEHIPENFFLDAIETYEDIDLDGLEGLSIFELRSLAHKLGVIEPISKTQDELIVEVSKIVEREMAYIY